MALVGTELRRSRVPNPRARTADTAPISVRRNLCTNPSAETNATGYTAIPGTGGAAAVTSSTVGASAVYGSAYARVAWTTATTAVSGGISWTGATGNGAAVSAGYYYAVSWYIQTSKVQRVQLQVEWRTAAGAVISTSSALAFVTTVGTYHRAQVVAMAPATAAFALVRVIAVAGTSGTNWANGDVMRGDGLLVERSSRVLDYFDANWVPYGTISVLGDSTYSLLDQFATVRTNLAGNPSGEVTGSIPYVITSGSAGATIATDTAHVLYGTRSVRANRVGGSGPANVLWQVASDAFAPGDQLTFSAYVWSATARTVTAYAEISLIDLTAATPGGAGGALPLNAGQWTRISWTVTIPAGGQPASAVYLGFQFADTLLDQVWVDGVLIERGTELQPYFDGSSPSDGLETHAWGLIPSTGQPRTDYGTSRRVAPHPSGTLGTSDAQYWQYATGGVGVRGSELRATAAGSGIQWYTSDLPVGGGGSYTAILQVRAVDAVTITALDDQTYTLTAGQTHEFRKTVTPGTNGSWAANIVQTDATPKRWVAVHFGFVAEAGYTGPYFDGTTPASGDTSRYVWAGTPDNSESIEEFLPPPDLTATVDTGSRGVQLLAEGTSNVQKITIQRTVAGYPIGTVRAARAATAVGGTLLAFDNEAPLGLPISYQTKAHYVDGSTSGWSPAVTVAIPVETGEVWLKDIGQPLRSVRVTLRQLGGKQRRARSEVHAIQDSEYPIVVTGPRLAPSEDVIIGTVTDAARSKVETLLATGQVVLLQCPPGWGRNDAYVALGDYQELRLIQHGPRPERNWQVNLQEVAEPTSERTGLPSSSYGAVKDDFASYRAVLANRSTYLGVLANTSDI